MIHGWSALEGRPWWEQRRIGKTSLDAGSSRRALGSQVTTANVSTYVAGLIGPGDRKNVQPMAERLAPGDYDQLHHFVAAADRAPDCRGALGELGAARNLKP